MKKKNLNKYDVWGLSLNLLGHYSVLTILCDKLRPLAVDSRQEANRLCTFTNENSYNCGVSRVGFSVELKS